MLWLEGKGGGDNNIEDWTSIVWVVIYAGEYKGCDMGHIKRSGQMKKRDYYNEGLQVFGKR